MTEKETQYWKEMLLEIILKIFIFAAIKAEQESGLNSNQFVFLVYKKRRYYIKLHNDHCNNNH